MKAEFGKMMMVWEKLQTEVHGSSAKTEFEIDQVLSSIFSLGPSYFYVIDFPRMEISNISKDFEKVHGVKPEEIHSIHDVFKLIHPEDLQFVIEAEEKSHQFILDKGAENITRYKVSYNFRFKVADGSYHMFNHQSLVLSVDESNNLVRSVNIHTDIDHLTQVNNRTWSLIGLDGESSYLNLRVRDTSVDLLDGQLFTARELEILSLITRGYSTKSIAETLFLSAETFKVHRKNILKKSGCNNVAELVARSVHEGWV